MLEILKVIFGNLTSKRATVPLPLSVPTPKQFRGPVEMDANRCIGCGMCSYVCVTNAITASDQGAEYNWAYEPGRCTFCGRCLERCPVHAIRMDSAPLEPYRVPGERSVEHVVVFGKCPECGEPVRGAHGELLDRAFETVSDQIRAVITLCERCRRLRLQDNLRLNAKGESENTL